MKQPCKSLMLVTALSLSMLGCGCNNKQADANKPVAVLVNGQPVPAAEINTRPGHASSVQMNASPAKGPSVSASDMKLAVDMELLRQAAVAADFEMDKKDSANPAASTSRTALALAYINQQLSAITEPAETEVSAYYSANPDRFAQRKHYELQTCSVKPSPEQAEEIPSQLDKSKKFSDFERWMKAGKIAHGCVPVSLMTDQADERILKSIKNVPEGGSIADGKGAQWTITFVQEMKEASRTLDQSRPGIKQMIKDKKRAEAYNALLKKLRDTAKIEYVPPYTANGFAAKSQPAPAGTGI